MQCAACQQQNPAEARFCLRCGAALAPATSGSLAPDAPRTVGGGRYRVTRFLGEGARKRVYLARDTRLDTEVAVSVVKTEGLDADGLTRVRREAQAMGRLRDHPHIVAIFDIGQEGAQPYIVSQYMSGGSVEERLREADKHRLPVAEAIRIATQLCEGLAHAHGLGIVHRDIKPGNVWLARDGTAKIGDFGLAVALDRSRITQEGLLVGTVAYLAPEQAMGRPPDPRSDLYGLGALLYEMLTGRPPFLGDDAVSVISQHVNTPPVAPSWHNPEVPQALEALVQQLLEKDPGKRPESARAVAETLRRIAAQPAEPATPPAPTGRAGDRRVRAAWGRFVGRRAELEQLKDALEAMLGGRGALVMLAGEPGIGKTRLAEEFAVYARLRGAQVLTGRSYEGSTEVPYSPFIEAFREYVRGRPDAELRRELGPGAPEVASLVSEIRKRFPDLPESPRLEGETERMRLFESATDFLRNAADASPIVLHLDDLHWADKPSLLLLRHVARRLGGARLLVVGTYRDVELDRTHALAEVLGALRRESAVSRVLLRGLPQEEVFDYLSALADDDPDAETRARRRALAEALHHETEGNPFFIGEVMTHLVESGKVYWDGTSWRADVSSPSELGIPEGVREVVGRRLSALSEQCNEMLTVASAMPGGFTWDVVSAVVKADEAGLLDALDEALAARLLRERSGSPVASYEFTHALIRQTLYEELSAPRRVLLHRRIGERLEALHGVDPGSYLAALAYHFFQAAPGGDVDKAIDYAVRAGKRAAAVCAFEEVAGHYERALQALDLRPMDDPERRCHLLLALAEAHARMGANDAARRAAGHAAELARALGWADGLALAGLQYGGEHMVPLQPDEPCVRLLEEALAVRAPDGDALSVRVLRRLGMEFQISDAVRAEHYGRRSVVIARTLGDPDLLALALSGLHWAMSGVDWLEERLALGRELLAVMAHPGARGINRPFAHQVMFNDLLESGDAEGARAELDSYARLAQASREPAALWMAGVHRGLWAILEGRFEDAERLANEAFEHAKRFENPMATLMHAAQISRVRAEQGRFEEIIRDYQQVIKATPVVTFRARLVQVYAELGREAEARAELEALAAGDFAVPRREFTMLYLTTLTYLAEGSAALRDRPRAERLYELLLPYARRNIMVANVACNGSVSRFLGLLAAALGRRDDAARHFEDAIDLDRRLGARPLLARVQVDYARMLLERGAPGDREHSLRLANEALGIAQALGMKLVSQRALETKLRAQGVDAIDTQRSVCTIASRVQNERPDLAAHGDAQGTVTLMFSDMEGFTRMTERLGDLAAHAVVQDHNRIVREHAAAHDGREVELRGDGFLLAFASARRAALCAIALQRAFAARNAQAAPQIRVRIGLHTGEAVRDADKLFGKTVIQAFRIADLARGGEILTSSVTSELLRNAGDLRFDAGREVELEGLAGMHRVFELAWT